MRRYTCGVNVLMCTYTCRHDYADFYCTYLQKDAGIWAHSCYIHNLGMIALIRTYTMQAQVVMQKSEWSSSYLQFMFTYKCGLMAVMCMHIREHDCAFVHMHIQAWFCAFLCTYTYEHDRDHVYIYKFAYQHGKPERWANVMPLKKSSSREFEAFTGTRKWRAWHVGREADW